MAALFETHYPGLCRLAYLILGDRRSAEEAVMDSFLRTFSAWGRIRNMDRTEAYLRRVVVNTCRSRIKQSVPMPGQVVEEAAAPPGASVEGALDVWRAVQRLPERRRATVVLRYFYDLPDAEIARLMGCSEGTVKSQLAKARATLALELKEETQDV